MTRLVRRTESHIAARTKVHWAVFRKVKEIYKGDSNDYQLIIYFKAMEHTLLLIGLGSS